MNYGYVRVSSEKQNGSAQQLEIFQYGLSHSFGIDEVLSETISTRKKLEDRELSKLLNKLKEGDRLLVTELSRLGRSMLEIAGIVDTILNKKIELIITRKDLIIKDDIQSKALVFSLGIAAELERELISERTKSGLAKAKAEGKQIGRPKGSISKSKLDEHEKEIRDLLEKGVSKASVCKIYDVTYPTLQNFIESRIETKKKKNKSKK